MKPIQYPSITRTLALLGLSAAASLTLALAPVNASAQTTNTTVTSGYFKSTDGNKGTFVTTVADTDTGSTEQTIFTRNSDKATSTDTHTITKNSDGTRTVVFSSNDFGTTAQFTSTRTVTPEKHGDAFGTGTFTNAAGVSGTLTTLESSLDNTSSVDATYTSANGVSTELRLNDDESRLRIHKIVTRGPDGTVTAVVTTLYITHFGK